MPIFTASIERPGLNFTVNYLKILRSDFSLRKRSTFCFLNKKYGAQSKFEQVSWKLE